MESRMPLHEEIAQRFEEYRLGMEASYQRAFLSGFVSAGFLGALLVAGAAVIGYWLAG